MNILLRLRCGVWWWKEGLLRRKAEQGTDRLSEGSIQEILRQATDVARDRFSYKKLTVRPLRIYQVPDKRHS
jgi:hypothetical protein